MKEGERGARDAQAGRERFRAKEGGGNVITERDKKETRAPRRTRSFGWPGRAKDRVGSRRRVTGRP